MKRIWFVLLGTLIYNGAMVGYDLYFFNDSSQTLHVNWRDALGSTSDYHTLFPQNGFNATAAGSCTTILHITISGTRGVLSVETPSINKCQGFKGRAWQDGNNLFLSVESDSKETKTGSAPIQDLLGDKKFRF